MRGNTARVAKLGQRRKIQGLILSGSGVQIPSLAPVFHTSCFTECVQSILPWNYIALKQWWFVHYMTDGIGIFFRSLCCIVGNHYEKLFSMLMITSAPDQCLNMTTLLDVKIEFMAYWKTVNLTQVFVFIRYVKLWIVDCCKSFTRIHSDLFFAHTILIISSSLFLEILCKSSAFTQRLFSMICAFFYVNILQFFLDIFLDHLLLLLAHILLPILSNFYFRLCPTLSLQNILVIA